MQRPARDHRPAQPVLALAGTEPRVCGRGGERLERVGPARVERRPVRRRGRGVPRPAHGSDVEARHDALAPQVLLGDLSAGLDARLVVDRFEHSVVRFEAAVGPGRTAQAVLKPSVVVLAESFRTRCRRDQNAAIRVKRPFSDSGGFPAGMKSL